MSEGQSVVLGVAIGVLVAGGAIAAVWIRASWRERREVDELFERARRQG